MNLKNKHLLCTQDWSLDELKRVLDLAEDMKRERYTDKYAGKILMPEEVRGGWACLSVTYLIHALPEKEPAKTPC